MSEPERKELLVDQIIEETILSEVRAAKTVLGDIRVKTSHDREAQEVLLRFLDWLDEFLTAIAKKARLKRQLDELRAKQAELRWQLYREN